MEANTPEDLGGLVARLSGMLAGRGAWLSTGDVAALRRLDPRRATAPAFWKLTATVLADHLPTGGGQREDAERRWAAILCGLAHLGDLHSPERSLGGVLADGDYSELRFTRLLRADAEALVDELPMLARWLKARGVAANWTDAARLILTADRDAEESVRRGIARGYYAALNQKEKHA